LHQNRFGISIVPHSIREVAATGVTYHAIEGPQPKAQIVLAYRSTGFSKVVRDFLEIARRLTRNRNNDIERAGPRTAIFAAL
jgi:hypothetical protein